MPWADLTDKERLELSWDALAVTVAALVGLLVVLALHVDGGVAECLLSSGPELTTSGLFFEVNYDDAYTKLA